MQTTSILVSTKLKVKEQDFKTVAENLPDIICRFTPTFRHLYVNPALSQITGVPQEAFLGRTPHDVMPKPFADFWVEHIQVVLESKEQHRMEFIFPLPTGDRYFESLLVPEFGSDGKIISVLSISRDITLMKEEEKRKDEFFGIVSHELKTPVTSLKAFTQVLHKRLMKSGDTEHVEYLEKIDTQINKLTTLISDLLDVTKIAGGKLAFHEAPFDFNALVKEIVEYIQPITDRHKIVIKGKATKKLIGDRDRVGQVLINLLSNAIKYSKDNTQIIIHVEATAGELKCCVQDFGAGIPDTEQRNLFQRFYRIRENEATKSGLGLGLYIAAQIIEQQGGKIWVESKVGKGSTFCFTLPYKKVRKTS